MIHITVSPKKYKIRVKGHAGYDDPGQDILCASVSYAFYNLAVVMLDYHEMGLLCKKPKMKDNPGSSSLDVIPKSEYEANVQICFAMFTRGIENLAAQYPDFVDLKILEY